MKELQKILLIIFVVGASITVLKVYVMDHQVIHLKRPLCNSNHLDLHTVITVVYSGQLGNNIWEYISVLAFMHLYKSEINFTAYIPTTLKAKMDYIFESVNIQQIPRIPKSCLKKEPYVLPLNESVTCDQLLDQTKCPFTLGRYSARYKEVIQYGIDNIKNELRFHRKYIEYSHKVFNRIKAKLNLFMENVTFVGMHYRGNDYINFLKSNYHNLVNGVPNATYYLKAMDYFKKKYKVVVFIIITIDFRWLRTNLSLLKNRDNYLIVNPTHNDLARDLVMLSQCNHSIISYGTFGTTTALFSGGTTFVYDLGIPLDQRGSTVAMGIAQMLSNWYLLT